MNSKPILISFALLFITGQMLFGQQNLVLNPSFEEVEVCPMFYEYKIDSCKYCFSPTYARASYFSICNGPGSYVGNNIWGYQWARTGTAYAGIATYFDSRYTNWPSRNLISYRHEWDDIPNYRQYIGMQLSESLKKNHLYRVSFYVSTGWKLDYPIAVHSIGAYFSVNKIDSTASIKRDVLHVFPQIENTRAQVDLADSVAWKKVEGEFVANGGERYLIIGNFRNEYTTEMSERPHRYEDMGQFDDNTNFCYQYFDDVSVLEIADVTGFVEQENKTKQITIAPNPSADEALLSLGNYAAEQIEITSITGEIVYTEKTSQQNELKIPTKNFSNGVYFITITNQKQKLTLKLLVQH